MLIGIIIIIIIMIIIIMIIVSTKNLWLTSHKGNLPAY